MRRCLLAPFSLVVLLLTAIGPQVADAACTTPSEMLELEASLRGHLHCARLELDGGSALPCDGPLAPSCAGSGVDSLVSLVTGSGAPPGRVGSYARGQLRCQRAILGATGRYLGRRGRELARGVRQARRASAFAVVRQRCDAIPVLDLQTTFLPTLGAPCAMATAPEAGPIDGARVARCVRAAIERLGTEMTTGVLRPNVVLVMTDDQNLASAASMERVDRLRARAVDFQNAFATTPVCAPSRASLLTGRYAHHHGVISNFLAAQTFDASSTLATWLSDAGYATALVGKYMNYAVNLEAVPPGWDEWQALIGEESGGNGYTDYRIDENGVLVQHGPSPADYSTDLLVGRSLNFMRDNAGRPFFLLFTPFAPHLPAIPAQRHEGSLSNIEPWRPPNWHEPDVSAKPTWVKFMKNYVTPAFTTAVDATRIAQLETLLAVDEAVGRIEDTLETLGLTDNTVLIFTSDHGYHWGEHWWDSKFTPYEESLRVPLVVSYPVLAPEPATRDELVLNIDLAPTIAALAGAAVPAGRDGQSLAALLSEPGTSRADFLIKNWGGVIVSPFEGVRGERFKYIKTLVTGGVTEELYDLSVDPHELSNLASDPGYAATLDALRQRLVELRDG